MLRIFRPRHIMWKYWMFQPEKPLRIMFGAFGGLEAQKMNQFSHMRLELWPQRNSFWQKPLFSAVLVKQLQDGNNELKSFNNRKYPKTENQLKISPIFHVARLHDADHCYLFFCIWIFNWLFMRIYTINPCWAREWMNAYNNYEFDH